MTTVTINTLADDLLKTIESEKSAAVAKTASVSHTPVMSTELGSQMLKVATALRSVASADITAEDLQSFRERYGI